MFGFLYPSENRGLLFLSPSACETCLPCKYVLVSHCRNMPWVCFEFDFQRLFLQLSPFLLLRTDSTVGGGGELQLEYILKNRGKEWGGAWIVLRWQLINRSE